MELALHSAQARLKRRQVMQVRSIVHNTNNELVGSEGHPLQPCIVMERGESLDLWSDRNAPDRAQAFTVCPVNTHAV